MKVRASYWLMCALFGVAGCGIVRGVAGDMGVPVRDAERANELAASESAQGANLTPGNYVFVGSDGAARTSFKLGEPVTGNLQASASPSQWFQKYTGIMQAQDMGWAQARLYLDGELLETGRTHLDDAGWNTPTNIPVDLWTGDDSAMPLTRKWASGSAYSPEEVLYLRAADKLGNGPHEVRFELYLVEPGTDGKPPIASGSYTLEVDDAGRKALARQSKRTVPPSKLAGENRGVRALVEETAQREGAKIFVARTGGIWAVERDAWQQPIRRRILANVVFQKDGMCGYRADVDFCQEHMGGGKYGDTWYCDDHQLFGGTLGSELFAIPCAAAAKLK